MKSSDAQKEATARYNKKAYDRINPVVKKGQRQIIKDFAASQGKSLNRFICDAIEYQMNMSGKETK
jgi:predicted HicB family RNase H-like nuclease